jgi:hypothetical protein
MKDFTFKLQNVLKRIQTALEEKSTLKTINKDNKEESLKVLDSSSINHLIFY